VATHVVRALHDAGLPPIVVNVNVPDLPFDEIRGLAFTAPGRTSKTDVAFQLVDETLLLRRRDNPPPYESRSEAHLLARGEVAVSVLALPWGQADTSECVESAITRNWPSEVQGRPVQFHP
jgi:5'-nucleotidase